MEGCSIDVLISMDVEHDWDDLGGLELGLGSRRNQKVVPSRLGIPERLNVAERY
jgi:hypothetical protein